MRVLLLLTAELKTRQTAQKKSSHTCTRVVLPLPQMPVPESLDAKSVGNINTSQPSVGSRLTAPERPRLALGRAKQDSKPLCSSGKRPRQKARLTSEARGDLPAGCPFPFDFRAARRFRAAEVTSLTRPAKRDKQKKAVPCQEGPLLATAAVGGTNRAGGRIRRAGGRGTQTKALKHDHDGPMDPPRRRVLVDARRPRGEGIVVEPGAQRFPAASAIARCGCDLGPRGAW